jgi:hypothetical protein
MSVSKPEGKEPEFNKVQQIKKATWLVAFFICALTGPEDRKRSVALLKQAGETHTFITFSAWGPFGPCVTSNSTS